MTDIRELYQSVILDHYKRPRNFGKLENAERTAEGFNPLCGDRISLSLRFDGERVVDVRFEGSGCAISTASSSLMTQAVKGRSRTEIQAVIDQFHRMLVDEADPDALAADLGKLVVMAGVREYPVRVKCATLAWHTLRAALEGKLETVSTEGRE